MADLLDMVGRFAKVVGNVRREEAVERIPEEPLPPDPDAEIKNALGGWAADERARKSFIPWLEQEMERAIKTAHLSHTNHAETTYALGVEQGLRFVRAQDLKRIGWRGRLFALDPAGGTRATVAQKPPRQPMCHAVLPFDHQPLGTPLEGLRRLNVEIAGRHDVSF